ncbi:MAG: hypothetical protein GY714_28390 [Desulfobacterales bacterium]|nr:hypothetical protein [Desulfobacterales bacterium]MCP4161894.1 hypothetical protein [Deltaproteobacteria bacterium]
MENLIDDKKILITGFGSCSAAGTSNDLWNKSLQKESCLTQYEAFSKDFPVKYVGRVPFDLTIAKRVTPLSRHGRLGITALKECIDSSCLDEMSNNGTGLIFGSASHGADKAEEAIKEIGTKPFSKISHHLVSSISNAGACHLLASHFKINGYVHSVEGASCSGMLTVISAFNLIKSGMCERVFSVVGEANLYPVTFLFYNKAAKVAGKTISFFGNNSFDRELEDYVIPYGSPLLSNRGVIAEGGGAVLLESLDSAIKRNAPVYGEVESVNFFFHSDNYGGKDRKLMGLTSVIEKYKNLEIDSVYLPITGCYLLDVGLYTVCSKYFKEVHTFTAEPVIGHTGAATAMINIILSIFSLKENTLLPTKNIPDKLDDVCELSPTNSPVKKSIKRILIVSAGWGGYNGACVIKKHE